MPEQPNLSDLKNLPEGEEIGRGAFNVVHRLGTLRAGARDALHFIVKTPLEDPDNPEQKNDVINSLRRQVAMHDFLLKSNFPVVPLLVATAAGKMYQTDLSDGGTKFVVSETSRPKDMPRNMCMFNGPEIAQQALRIAHELGNRNLVLSHGDALYFIMDPTTRKGETVIGDYKYIRERLESFDHDPVAQNLETVTQALKARSAEIDMSCSRIDTFVDAYRTNFVETE